MNIDKVKKALTAPIFNHINSLTKEQLIKQRDELVNDIKLIEHSDFRAFDNIWENCGNFATK